MGARVGGGTIRLCSTNAVSAASEASLSHLKGPSNTPLLAEHTAQMFSRQVEKYGDRCFVVSLEQRIRYSWNEVWEKAQSLAAGLHQSGFRKGDKLAVWLPNCAEWVVTQIATAMIGVPLVALNPAYRAHELKHALALTECKGLLLRPRLKSSDYFSILKEVLPGMDAARPGEIHSAYIPTLRQVFMLDSHDHHTPPPSCVVPYHDLLIDRPASQLLQQIKSTMMHPDDIINIQMSSGTTGLPKAVALSHRNILNNGYFCGERMQLTDSDRLVIPVPLFHCFGLVLGNLAAMAWGARIIYPSAVFHSESCLRAIETERATAVHGTPTMLIAMLEHAKKYDCSSLRTGIAAGAVVPSEVMKALVREMNLSQMTIAYGMTETSPVSFQTWADTPFREKVETVGLIHPHAEVKIVDPETRKLLPRNTVGELCTKGYLVMQGGYYGQPDKTRETIDEDGFVKTGDLATMNEDGFVRISGRLKEMISRGGEKISPAFVENFLLQYPKIKNVTVLGVPDAKFGEQVCAFVISKDGETISEGELLQFCHGKIAHFQIPRYWIFTDKFTTTANGKVQRYLMRGDAIRMLGL
ncbi:mitochondrial AMP-binding protein (fatty-acyl-CoA synthase) [Andalucia godoyi]|uniref:Mitochondrial AMP-binding protein (Fatty-acyl-CoA synthase) n=1 Tax=Andalucia godoyi TaxID=505711 RepID=A0A8K0F4N1_ANDGO|nr:mitochondrial AMP-binding protein (fatty-acyl-CoA synthase) [Andalucia godoyi]|eukprot:ANDGO_05432.mRNA.1 mitochondrial AMP-binding protein (fatty-acyl-CoA synthase)